MARLPPLLPTPPASLKLQDTNALESGAPRPHLPLEPPASDSRRQEPNSPPPSKVRCRSRSPPPYKVRHRSRSPPSYKVRRRSRSPPPSEFRRRSRSPPAYKVGRRSRSPPPYKVRRRSRSPSLSEVRRRSRSPPPYKVGHRSRSPTPSKVRRRSRSPPEVRHRSRSPSKVWRRSRSPPPSESRRRSRSPPPSEGRCRSRSPSPSKVRRRLRSRSPLPSRVWRRSRSPLPSKVRRRSRSPLPSKVKRRSRSPPYVSVTQRAKQPSAEAAVEGEKVRPSSLDESSVENRPSHSHCSCKHAETSSAAVEKKPDPVIRGNEQELHSEKMDGKNQSDHKAPSRNARRKWVRRRVWAEAKNQMREMKRDKLLEKIKKLQDCVWLLEKDGADTAEIMELRSLLESTKKQYEENEAHLAQQGSSASHQVLNKDILKTHVETVPSPVEIVERDEQNMDSGEAEGRSLKGCKAVSNENELAEELNHLTSEIETARQDRDYQSAQAQSLMADMAKQKEIARIYGVELEDAMRRVAALEEEDLLQRETIWTLQVQLASANEKLTVSSST